MSPYEDDDDDEREEILKGLSGEVDDYAADQLPKEMTGGPGVTIEISVKPHQAEPDGDEEEEKDKSMEDGNGEHDPIAHILGMCGGGCAK